MKVALSILFIVSAVAAEQLCTPGSVFKMDCNICSCTKDGLMACTDMACPERKRTTRSVDTVCEPLSTFSPDSCNTCTCSADGKRAMCTMALCMPTRAVESPKKVCEPRSQFKNYCNTCGCSEDGTTFACTRMACDENIWNQDGSLRFVVRSAEDQKRVCEPNTKFNDDCNTCMCSSDGLSKMCTMMTCESDYAKVQKRSIVEDEQDLVCTPNAQFNEYCNTCLCSRDGRSKACTMMYCDKDVFNFDGSIKTLPSSERNLRAAKSLVCTPYSQFKESCNTCTCSRDGLSKLCTMMLCDVEI